MPTQVCEEDHGAEFQRMESSFALVDMKSHPALPSSGSDPYSQLVGSGDQVRPQSLSALSEPPQRTADPHSVSKKLRVSRFIRDPLASLL